MLLLLSRWTKRSFMAMTPSELINKYVATLCELYYGLPVNGVWERRRIAREIYFWLFSLCLIIIKKNISVREY